MQFLCQTVNPRKTEDAPKVPLLVSPTPRVIFSKPIPFIPWQMETLLKVPPFGADLRLV